MSAAKEFNKHIKQKVSNGRISNRGKQLMEKTQLIRST